METSGIPYSIHYSNWALQQIVIRTAERYPLQLILLIHNKIYITKIHIIFLFTGDINLYYERTIIYLLGKYVEIFSLYTHSYLLS